MSSQERQISTFRFSAFVRFGVGAIARIVPAVQELNPNSILIVTDRGVIEAGIVAKVMELLDATKAKYEIFSDVQANPTDTNVDEGANLCRARGCDLIVAVGGGIPWTPQRVSR